MSSSIGHEVYTGPEHGVLLDGLCAACDYSGMTEYFQVWSRGAQHRVLCNQCSSDVARTMLHEGWHREDRA